MTINLRRYFHILKLTILSAALVLFGAHFFTKIEPLWWDVCFITLLCLSIIHIVLQVTDTQSRLDREIPVTALGNLVWFSFLYFSRIFPILDNPQDSSSGGLKTVLVLLSLVFLVVYFRSSLKSLFKKVGDFRLKPSSLITLSFVTVIFVGAILLFLPISRQPSQPPLHLVDAFFTATSAVCVTGLTVVDTGTYFSRFGQIVILFLIQIGALGIMTFTGFFTVLLGEKMSLFGRFTTQNAVNEAKSAGMGRFLISIISATFLIEMTGSLLLWFRFSSLMSWQEAIYYSIFHGISAFCNAGFSLYSDSLTRFQSDLLVNGVIMGLVILGGLGFAVIVNIKDNITGKAKTLSLHSKLVMTASAILIVMGAVIFLILEYHNLLEGKNLGQKIMISLFNSVTCRTAGFNTVDYSQARGATLFFNSILMFIGASPGSTGGGIKTTTFMVLIFTIYHTLRERSIIRVFGRDLHIETIRKGLVLFFLSLSWVFIVITVLSSVENQPFTHIMFETLSAFGTVGLSAGVTPTLSQTGKAIIMVTMLIGRVGPVTLMFSLGMNANPFLFARPVEKVQIG